MRAKRNSKDTGSVLLCVLGTIVILSLIGANVLLSSATRLNASVNHVRAWKESLSAAESGGDVAFAKIREQQTVKPTAAWPWAGWNATHVVNGRHYYESPVTTIASDLQTKTVVDECYFDNTGVFHLGRPDPTLPDPPNTWFRLRSKGTAHLPGLKRSGMDDALIQDNAKHFADFGSTEMQDITARGKGDSLLRKIDFEVDHFVATYGPEGEGVGQAPTPPTAPPSISRRIEQLVEPVTPFFDAAIKAVGSFYGLGSASYVDSYDCRNGPYDPSVKNNPSSPYYIDSREGNVATGNALATIKGDIYGDLRTDGGTVVSGSPGIVYGIIDNNVPFSLENYEMPSTSTWNYVSIPTNVNSATTLAPTSAGTSLEPNYYLFSSINNVLTVNPAVVNGTEVDTYIAIQVTGDIGSISGGTDAGITVNPKVHLKIYFNSNVNLKATKIVNTSPNTPGYPNSGPFAGNLQFYGISPNSGTQSVILDSGGGQTTVSAAFYAPSANVEFKGAPDFFGTVQCKTFYTNGNITWHYDRALNDEKQVVGYRIASYVEDTR